MTGQAVTGLFEAYPDGVALLNVETGTVLRVNERCGELAGRPPSQLAGKSLSTLSPDGWTPRTPVGVLLSRARDGRVTFDWRIERPDGTCLDLQCAMRTVEDWQAIITVRKQPADVVSGDDDGRDLQELLDGMNDAVFVVDWDGNYIDANRVATERLGYTRAELLSMGPADISPPDHAERVDERLGELKDSETLVFETVHVTADGTSLPVEINARRITYHGEPAVLSVARDIGTRKERERRLRTFERAVEHAGHAIYITDTDGTIEYVNPAFEEITGYDSDRAVGRTPSILSTGENDEDYYADLWETILDGAVWEERIENERADGTRYVADQTIAPIHADSEGRDRPDGRAESNNVVQFVAIQQDVTEQREREHALERYRQLIENVPVGVYRNKPGLAGTFEKVNPAMVEMFGADDAEDLIGRPVAELYRTPSQRELFSRKLEREGVVVDEELRLETLDGETFWGAVTAVKHEVDGEVYYDGIIQDVTERRESERELRLREQRFRRLFEEHNAPMLLIDPETGTIEQANAAAADFYGYDRGELAMMDIQDINQRSDEEVADSRREADEEKQNRFIFPHELADGEIRQVEVDTTPIYTGDRRLLFSILHDVTERERTRERLEHQNEQLELLNRVVRHDIRNDMSVVLGHAEILNEYVVDDGQQYLAAVQEHSKHVVELTKTARELMGSLLDDDGADPGSVDLKGVLRAELDDARAAYDDAEFTGAESLPTVEVCGNELLSSVFRNLLNNAVQHNDADHPRVSVSVEDCGATVEVTVADNGPGIPDGQKREIFGKGEHGIESSGTGLGLYLVYTFIEQFGGEVWVTDNEPTGAIFHVELPKAN